METTTKISNRDFLIGFIDLAMSVNKDMGDILTMISDVMGSMNAEFKDLDEESFVMGYTDTADRFCEKINRSDLNKKIIGQIVDELIDVK